jgi:outer membrane immunogenic protein
MKKFLLATSALALLGIGSASAADLSRPAYQPPPPVYSWTGLYWGVNIGYSWGREKDDFTAAAGGAAVLLADHQKVDGVIGGFQSGYNHQFGQWVWGWETDFQASGQKGSTVFGVLPGVTVATEHKLPWLGTTRSRLGILWSPTVMVYGTAGVAYGQTKSDYVVNVAGVTGAVATANIKDNRVGWTAGAGIEGVIGGGWTAKLEYLYVDLGTETVTLNLANVAAATLDRKFSDNIVRVGFNYRWGGGSAY